MSYLNLEHIDISFSNKGLWPWEGGCLWEREGQKPLIQLRKIFQKKERYLWIYTRSEILAHEAVHASRLTYNEPIFEEILAYQTSSNAFRRFFGPMFRNSKESLIFLLSSLIVSLTPLPLMILCFLFFVRLLKYQYIFFKLKKIFISQYGNWENAFPHVILLKDDEILKMVKDDGGV